jgi:hypothetical protein
MSFLRIPSLFAAGLLLAGLSSTASAQFSLNQSFATVGSRLVLTADEGDVVDFGDKKAKVFLSQPGSKKKNNLKVLSWTSSQIEVQVKKAKVDPAGDNTYDVNVQLKGKGVQPIVREDGITLRLIELPNGVADSTPSIATEGVVAQYQTDKAPKAKIGGKPAKIVNWAPFGGPEGIQGAGTFDIIPHKKLANDVYDLELKTKAGKVLIEDAVTITGSTVGKPSKPGVSLRAGKDKLKSVKKKKAPDSPFKLIEHVTDTTNFTAGGAKGTKLVWVMSLFIEWLPGDGDKQLTEADLAGHPVEVMLTRPKQGTIDHYQFTSFEMNLCEGAGRGFGTFRGTLTRTFGTGPQMIEVTDGDFNMEIFEL